jgi:6-phosphogluconolactonase
VSLNLLFAADFQRLDSQRGCRKLMHLRNRVPSAPKLAIACSAALLALGLVACGGASRSLQPAPSIQHPNLAFVSNTNSNTISVFEMDPGTGQLFATANGPFAAGNAPEFLAVDASGKFLYVANNNSNDVSAFQIDGATGALTPVPGSPFPAGSQPKGVALVSSGNLELLFVANESSDDISAFQINPASGALTAVPGSPFLGVDSPIGITANPAATLLYVTSLNSNVVSGFQISASTGALSPVPGTPPTTGQTPMGLLFDPDGRFLYVADHMQNTFSGYSVDTVNGSLARVSGPAVASTGCPGCHAGDTRPTRLIANPNHTIAYASNVEAGTLSTFQINNGSLSPLSADVATGQHPFGMAFDPQGSFLYVANKVDNTISGFSVNPTTGVLSPLPNSPFPASASGPVGIVFIPTH